MRHIRKCFSIDQQKRFQALRKIRQSYFNLSSRRQLKMKVCVAARIFSSCYRKYIGTNAINTLPSGAIYTAQFTDCLFDSFNGRKPNSDLGIP